MGIRLHAMPLARKFLRRSLLNSQAVDVPKGHFAVYVGENETEKKRYVVPISYLDQSAFQDMLRKVEEEFGYSHPMGGLTIPCNEEVFLKLTSCFSSS
ncbi:hypothetical protein ACHQM5_015577 [Ranunculus cassubicifolius]